MPWMWAVTLWQWRAKDVVTALNAVFPGPQTGPPSLALCSWLFSPSNQRHFRSGFSSQHKCHQELSVLLLISSSVRETFYFFNWCSIFNLSIFTLPELSVVCQRHVSKPRSIPNHPSCHLVTHWLKPVHLCMHCSVPEPYFIVKGSLFPSPLI